MNQHVHLIGIGGSGLSSIARFLLESGYTVTGSDRLLSPQAQELILAGARVFIGHKANQIVGANLVVRSSAIPDANPEVIAARAAGIPVLKRAEFLSQLLNGKTVIAVAGTHGKTTTTAMLAWVLHQLNQDPSYIIGGVSKNFNRSAHAGASNIFVIEADEYDNMFLGLSPAWIILTVVEHDHPDCFPSLADYRHAFSRFIDRLNPGGSIIYNADDAESRALITPLPTTIHTYSYSDQSPAAFQAVGVRANRVGGCDFSAVFPSPATPSSQPLALSLQVPGRHNVRNALAVLGLIHQLGLNLKHAATALSTFTGTGRRFDIRGSANRITIIDDYAHHPTEIRATLAAARLRYPSQRIWAVWQPHTFSRTKSLWNDFLAAFQDADLVIVTEVYGARESSASFSASELVAQMPHSHARFARSNSDASTVLFAELHPGDILLVLSAGDADQISQQVLDYFSVMESKNARIN